VEQKWTDFVSFGSSKKSKTVVPSSKMASGGGGGGGSSTQPPGGEDKRAKPVGEKGEFWKSIAAKSKQEQAQFSNYAKKARNQGEIRSDGKNYFQFDKFHKGKPGEHLHRYRKSGKFAVLDAEIDPQTGRVLRIIIDGKRESWF
jgi:hypothetical protein